MSKFQVLIKRIDAIEPHPNADALELAKVGGYRCVVRKGSFKSGELIAYIPEAAVLPDWLLQKLGLWKLADESDPESGKGTLAGSRGNRVKAIKLRGALSQGIVFAGNCGDEPDPQLVVLSRSVCGKGQLWQSESFVEGDDVAEFFGIKKYEPPIPVSMAGEVFNAGQALTLGFDVENWKSYPNVLVEGEDVVFTEKLHGTCTVVGILPKKDAHPEAFGEHKTILIFSKGLGAKGLVLKNNSSNQDNLYVRATRELIAKVDAFHRGDAVDRTVPLFILGETFGPGVQDLAYGKELGFRVFAAAEGYRGEQHYLDWDIVCGALKERYGYQTVPMLYRGPFSEAVLREHTDGKTSLDAKHIREGIVVVPSKERLDSQIGRVCLKSVSADYLTRKGGTEFT